MKDHWSASKDKLVGAEEGSIRSGEIPSESKPRERNVCKKLIQCVKLVLYLELLLFVGWACYSTWQTYHIESMEVKVVDSIREPDSQRLSGQDSMYDKIGTATTSRKSDDEATPETKNVLRAETVRPEKISESDESTIIGEAVTTTEYHEADEERTESTANNVATDLITGAVNSDSTEEFDKQSETTIDSKEGTKILKELERNEEIIENYLLLSLMLQNAWVPRTTSASRWSEFGNDSQDETDEKSEERLISAQEQTYPVYDDIVVSDESSRWVFPEDSLESNDRQNVDRMRHSASARKLEESVKEDIVTSDESVMWAFPDDSRLGTTERLDLYRKSISDSTPEIEEVKESANGGIVFNDEFSSWANPDDPVDLRHKSMLDAIRDLEEVKGSAKEDIGPAFAFRWTFSDDPILNDRFEQDRNSDLIRGLEEVEKSVNEKMSDERPLGFTPFYDNKDYLDSALDYYDQHMIHLADLYDKKETSNNADERKVFEETSSIPSILDPFDIGLRSLFKLTDFNKEKKGNEEKQIQPFASDVVFPDSKASSSQSDESLETFFKFK